ncbi:MAG: dUTP pyrophosphatase [Patescibacteria group bacterium]|nr:dUTP pyrophosphatase [Patescibacteria group bacterium]
MINNKLNVKITRLRKNAIIPVYQTEQSAGMDLHACIDEPKTLQPLERAVIPTGLSIELPAGYESQIRARSGMTLKHGITMANGIGTIDADYRGEYGVIVFNLSDAPFTIEPNTRIAQLVVSRYETVNWQEVQSLSDTTRGVGGYGSTGVQA